VAIESGDVQSTDLELMREARGGDLAAFHELVDRHAAYLYAVAVGLTGHAADAEDLVQETLTGAFRGLRSFEGRSSVKTWLTRILVRQAARQRRKLGGRRSLPLEVAEGRTDKTLPHTAADERMDVTAAIGQLSPEHREVIILRELEGLSYDEMAEVLEVPRGTVESRLFRARAAMKELLKEYFA
jgi:RNA polymerase sigma-70 factor (ECF subfamily)